MRKLTIISILFTFATLLSCSDDDDNQANDQANNCLADSFEFVETSINNLSSTNNVIVTFDVTNNSSTDYSIGLNPINTTVIVTTGDGSEFETTNILTVQALSSGATTTVDVLGSYGEGRTFSSYKLLLSCR